MKWTRLEANEYLHYEIMGFAIGYMYGHDVVRQCDLDTNPEDCNKYEVHKGAPKDFSPRYPLRDAAHKYVLQNNFHIASFHTWVNVEYRIIYV